MVSLLELLKEEQSILMHFADTKSEHYKLLENISNIDVNDPAMALDIRRIQRELIVVKAELNALDIELTEVRFQIAEYFRSLNDCIRMGVNV